MQRNAPEEGVSAMIIHRHSHVTASGVAPTNVHEGNWCDIMVACNSPRNSLLKIKKRGFGPYFYENHGTLTTFKHLKRRNVFISVKILPIVIVKAERLHWIMYRHVGRKMHAPSNDKTGRIASLPRDDLL
jgi:hypothetical protein